MTRWATALRGGCKGSAARNSVTSCTIAEKRRAFSAYAGSGSSSSPYSFRVEPQPAELTMIASTPAARKASMLRRASSRAVRRSPAWRLRAPQQR